MTTTETNTSPDEGVPEDRGNPFAPTTQRAQLLPATIRVEEQRAIAEVQGALVVARANPRDEVKATDRILLACQRTSLAERAVYQYARGGSDITGASIRLAEAMAQHWGNLQFGIRELGQADGTSTVQAYAWDVESNTRREVTFQVRHERDTKKGRKRLTDQRDIYELVANLGARRVRSCILALIPGDVVERALRECEHTLKTTADVTESGVAKLAAAFLELGVSRPQLEQWLQRRLDSIQPAQVVSLRRIYASIRDGMSTPSEWFEEVEEPKPTADVKGKGVAGLEAAAAAAKKAKADKPPEKPAEPTPPPPPATPEEIERNALVKECSQLILDKLGNKLDAGGCMEWIREHSGAANKNSFQDCDTVTLLRLRAALLKIGNEA